MVVIQIESLGEVSMSKTRYRLKSSTIAILTCDEEHKYAITIPERDTVEVEDELNGNRLVDVEWEGRRVMMFTIDLRIRGELVLTRSA